MERPARGYRISPLLLGASALFVACLVTSNIIAAKTARIGPLTAPAAIVLFPLAYLFGDVLTEVWGYATARMVIWTGFLANIVAVGFVAIAIVLPSDPSFHGQSAYAAILGQSPRLVGASLAAYLCGEFLNSFVLAKLKLFTRGRFLWTRTIGSTVVGQGVDSAIFISAGFLGVLPGSVVLTSIGSVWLLKVAYEVVATPLTYLIVTVVKRVEGVDAYDRHTSFAPIRLAALRGLLREPAA
ncbi:MAG TPA: queuosine precursor transporter [Candidatus Binatia bacterium]|nr:queuosine precursor transporter [Candidatus Binatia bacterium]